MWDLFNHNFTIDTWKDYFSPSSPNNWCTFANYTDDGWNIPIIGVKFMECVDVRSTVSAAKRLINKNCLDSRLINLSCRRKFLIPQFDPFSLQPECAQLLISTRLWPPQSPESGQCWPALIKTVFMMEDGPDQEGDEQSSPCLVSLFWLSWVTSNVEKYKIHDDGTKALSWILLITAVLRGNG